jgi:hypothetical protein
MTNSWYPWCNQFTGDEKDCIFNRANKVITQLDVDAAIAWYEKEFGVLPKYIATYKDTFTYPEEIEFVEHGGVLKWEVFVGPAHEQKKVVLMAKVGADPSTKPSPQPAGQKSGVVTPLTGEDVPPTLKIPDPLPENASGILKHDIMKQKKVIKGLHLHGHQRGQPPKVGDISWVTLYRRGDPSYKKARAEQKVLMKQQQGVLEL